jgi:hypothetical protein
VPSFATTTRSAPPIAVIERIRTAAPGTRERASEVGGGRLGDEVSVCGAGELGAVATGPRIVVSGGRGVGVGNGTVSVTDPAGGPARQPTDAIGPRTTTWAPIRVSGMVASGGSDVARRKSKPTGTMAGVASDGWLA